MGQKRSTKQKKSMKENLENMSLRRKLDEFTYLTTCKLLTEKDYQTALEIQRTFETETKCKEQACYLREYRDTSCYLHWIKGVRERENDSERIPLIKAKG